jgi:hypothetical protein
VADKGSGATAADLIEDLLWLPTEREMFGFDPAGYTDNGAHSALGPFSVAAYETAANQARLGYYGSDAKRVKYDSGNSARWYWQASPHSGSAAYFCDVVSYGFGSLLNASEVVGGCAPAFCVR